MDENQFDDLKQFIVATASQTEKRLETKIETMINDLRGEMLDGFAGVGEAIEHINNRLDERDTRFKTCNKRLTKLERQAA
ncbi:MAG TPA: hypothetical protein VJP80_06495 [Candidatus Saccharimonadales bacterium]|nr:hypothetical protein [Candidatus Saccharimonadales bacterium]